jgi:hypothetical protein
MSHKDEPRRLFESDDAPAGLRSLLVRAHEDAPPEATVAELLGRIERQAPLPGSSARWPFRHGAKALLAVVLVGTVGAVSLWAIRDRTAAHAVPPPEMPTLQQAPAHTAAMEPPVPSPRLDEQTAAPEAPAPSRPLVGGNRAPRAVRGRSLTETAISTGAGAASAEEYALLRSARRALADHPAQALHFTDEHLRRFTQGMLVQEREAIAVEALVHLGRTDDAKLRAQAFFASFPGSPYRGRVERALTPVAPVGRP